MSRKTLSAFLLVTLLLSAAVARTYQTPAKPAPATTKAPVTIPFELANRHIMLKVKVNNSPRPLSFVFDTGDKFAIIDIDRAKELGLNLRGRIRVGGAGSETLTGAFVDGATFTIPGFEGFSQPLSLAIPMKRLNSRFGTDCDGILGSDFINEFVVEVDYEAGVLRLHDKEQFSYSGPGDRIPVQFNNQGHPILEAEVTPVGGTPIKGKFVLDLGSGGALVLYTPFAAENQLPGKDMKTIKAIGVGGAGGAVTGKFGRVARLTIGKFGVGSPITLFSEDTSGAFASSALAGNIGHQIASRFKVFLDYPRKQIIFEPNANYNKSFDRAFSGLVIVAEGADYRSFRIDDILDDSPAFHAGLKKNDVITSIDGKPTSQLTLTKLNEMFERTESFKLTVTRETQTVQITLTPRKLI